jgi:hypothetical protein
MRILLLLLVATVTGCASGPKYSEIKNSIPELGSENGRIFFYRPSVIGAAVQPNILLNGTIVGEMVPKGFFFVDRTPGQYVVSAKTESEATLQLTLLANQTQYVKGGISIGIFVGRPDLTLVDSTNALIDLQDLSYIGTAALDPGSANGAPPGVAAAPRAEAAGGAVRMKDLEGLLQNSGAEKK